MDDARAERLQRVDAYIEASRKNIPLAFALAISLGPLGCLYTSPWLSLVNLTLLSVFTFFIWPLAIVTWVACAVYAPFYVRRYNRKIKRHARWLVH